MQISNSNEVLSVAEDTIFLDEMLLKAERINQNRFTIAHECAHQILARIEEKRVEFNSRRYFNSSKKYNCHELLKTEDWREWQANSLGAMLLMPKSTILSHLNTGRKISKPTSFGGYFNEPDYQKITELSKMLKVSKSAVIIRLKEIGCLKYKQETEFFDPLNIMVG